jgi:hypothetical protein
VKDLSLADLNFREIVDYGGQPPAKSRYPSPLACRGYCISCEESGLLKNTGGRLDRMSHGCDSADFEAVLGPMPREGAGVAAPVLFLLENPGGDYGLGEPVDFQGLRKQPPVNHYYWIPTVQTWPRRVADLDGNYYGSYLAHLMWRHQLLRVYITNLVKCKWVRTTGGGSGDTALIVRHCAERYLMREVQIFAPRVVFCFGRAAERGFRELASRVGLNCPSTYLRHPSYIQNRWGASGRSQEELFQENDDAVKRAIAQLA